MNTSNKESEVRNMKQEPRAQNQLQEIRQDADDFIMNLLKKIQPEKKIEIQRLIEGAALFAPTIDKRVS